LKHGLTVEADKISASAREKIESRWHRVTMREKPAPHGARVAREPSPAVDASQPEAKAASKCRLQQKNIFEKENAGQGRIEEETIGKELAFSGDQEIPSRWFRRS
jgi:hypothetical protein